MPSKAELNRAARWFRREMSKRRDPFSHPSHLAAKILKEADEKFSLGSFGVEGWANDTRSGVQYLNFGDTYSPTLVVCCTRYTWRCHVAMGGWGPYAGG